MVMVRFSSLALAATALMMMTVGAQDMDMDNTMDMMESAAPSSESATNTTMDAMEDATSSPTEQMEEPAQAGEIVEPVDLFDACLASMIANDSGKDNRARLDGFIHRAEYLDFFNGVATSMCQDTRPTFDFYLQATFNSIACLCRNLEGDDSPCCLGDSASINTFGAAAGDTPSEEQLNALTSACLMTQNAVGADNC